MKTLTFAAIRCSLLFLIPAVTYGISAEWELNPLSGDWNTADNWTPMEVPNGAADTATFGLSNIADVSISANTEVNGITFIAAATNPYTITASPGLTLTISGTGVTNNSGITQNFVTAIDAFGNSGTIVFSNSATAGTNVAYLNNGNPDFIGGGNLGQMIFKNKSTASSANIFNEGSINFLNRSTAGNIFNEFGTIQFSNSSTAGNANIFTEGFGTIQFSNSSTAGNANIVTDGFATIQFSNSSTAGNANIDFFTGGDMSFSNTSTAGSATINAGDITRMQFFDSSSAGSATITNEGEIDFLGSSTAGSANISAFGHGFFGGLIVFADSSKGGTAQIDLEFGVELLPASLDISPHNAPGVTVGSIEGDGNVFLGANNLTVGSNNLSTTFSGVIQDGGQNGGMGGSLTKIGSGTLVLSGANTYTGDTNVNRGVLQVDGSITSNTFVNHGGTLAGAGTINGNVINRGEVSPGSAGAAGVLTVVHNYTQAEFAHLMIQIAGVSTDQFSVLDVLGTANLSGLLNPDLLNGFVPTVGETFTFLNYGAVNGTLSIFNPNIDNLPEHWEVSYFPTFAVLTVVAGNVHVSDQGSTFLLLTLGLLSLVTYRGTVAA